MSSDEDGFPVYPAEEVPQIKPGMFVSGWWVILFVKILHFN